jgi:class 3 adenylate cyclase
MSFDFDELTMTEIIRLQDQLSQALKRRFEKPLALTFSDIVDSTKYFARFGNETGRQLQQRHFDLLARVTSAHDGRIVDTAGDGGFMCFPTVVKSTHAMIELQKLISGDNAHRQREHQLKVRIGIHFGPVLTDGTQVTGDPVNVCARVASTAAGGEIRLSGEAFRELNEVMLRVRCKLVPNVELKGVGRAVEMMVLAWRDSQQFPSTVTVVETDQEITLPDQDVIAFGRLATHEGLQANDVILAHPDPNVIAQISRWHFELRRHPDGFVLRQVSDQLTEVDGLQVQKGSEAQIRSGSTVQLAKVMTLRFDSPSSFDQVSTRTQMFQR